MKINYKKNCKIRFKNKFKMKKIIKFNLKIFKIF